MKRNINGRGTTYQDKKGLYTHEITYTNPTTGELKRKKFRNKKSALAIKKADEFLNNLSAGLNLDADKILVKDWVDKWLSIFVAPRVRPRTLEKYTSCLYCYIVPQLGHKLLMKLTSLELQHHFNTLGKTGGLQRTGISSATIRNARRYFTSCLDEAIKHGFLLRNPAKDTSPPKLQTREHVLLTDDEIKTMLELASTFSDGYINKTMTAILQLTLHTGMRMGEVFGLKWENINFSAGAIFLSHTLVRINKQGYTLQEPKTKLSKRKILLATKDMQMLKNYKQWQEQFIRDAGEDYTKNNYVFSNMCGGAVDFSRFNKHFRNLLNQAGISDKFTFHSLRHNHASMLLKAGVNPKVIQERLGHSNISTTLDIYSHIMPDMQQQAIMAIENLSK